MTRTIEGLEGRYFSSVSNKSRQQAVQEKPLCRGALLAGVTALAFTSLAALPAMAQQQDAAKKETVKKEETIIVSARRREESLQDVPIAISAFSGAELEEQGAINITYLNQVVPNVTIETSRSTNTTLTAFIRGVGQQDPVAGFEQGVGLYVDDVYINRPQGAILDIYDVERVEVLRGPQGTLYGRNTIGGAIKYITKRLGPDPEFSLRASLGSYWQNDLVLTAGLPVNDKLRVGGAFARLNRNGFGKNLVQKGVDNYNKDILAGRASIEILPNDSLFFKLSGDITRDHSDPRNGYRLVDSQFSRNPDGSPTFPVLRDRFDTRADLNIPKSRFINRGVSLLGEWQLNDNFKLKNIVAYRDNEAGQQIDFDSLPVEDLQAPFDTADHQFSEEFQVLYSSGNINGITGFYYLNAGANNQFDVILGELGALIGLPRLNAFTSGNVQTDTWSVFGDYTFDLGGLFGMTGFELSLGGRYTEDIRKANVLRQTMLGNSSFFGGTPVILATTSNFNGRSKFTDFSPRVSLAWRPNEDNKAYVSFSQGFKGGGFDPRGQTSGTPDFNNDGTISPDEVFRFMSFKPENIDNYEVGLKSSFAGGRVSTNIAAFYADYKNVQIPGSIGIDTDGDGVDDSFAGVTSNAGKATMKGVEFEGSALLAEDLFGSGDSWSGTLSIGYIDAAYDRFIVAAPDGAGGTALTNDADFLFIQNTPRWTVNVTSTYSFPLSLFARNGAVSLIESVSYRSLTHQFEFASPIDQAGYVLFDASMVWNADDGKWQVGVHGRNLFGQSYKVAGYDFFTGPTSAPGVSTAVLGLEGNLTAFFGDPRTVTATVKYKY